MNPSILTSPIIHILLTYIDLTTLNYFRQSLLSTRHPFPPIDWYPYVQHDKCHHRPSDGWALEAALLRERCNRREHQCAGLYRLSDVHSIYRHQHQWTVSPHTDSHRNHTSHSLPSEAFYTPETRGLCVNYHNRLIWHDVWTRHTYQIVCPFLHRLPHELDSTLVLHARHPDFAGTYQQLALTTVIAASGTPEDTMCQTNYGQLYRVQMTPAELRRIGVDSVLPLSDTFPPTAATPPTITEHLLGASFDATVTQLRLVHFRAPFLVVTGFPVAAAPSIPWRHFGVWNMDTGTATLSECRPPHGFPPPMLRSLSSWCTTLGVRGFWRYELLCADDDTGATVYWVYRGALGRVHLPTGATACVGRYPAFCHTRVTQIAVSRLWGVIGVYNGDDHTWRVFDLATGTRLLHTFMYQFSRTRLVFLPHQHKCVLTRRMGGTIWERVVDGGGVGGGWGGWGGW